MQQFLMDARYALRGFRRNPTSTLVVIVMLAFGIGANTAIYGVVDSVLLQPLPLPNPDDIAFISGQPARDAIQPSTPIPYEDFRDWRDQLHSFDAIAAYRTVDASMRTAAGPERVSTVRAAGSIFTVLGIEARVGRLFDTTAEQPGRDRVAVISESMWQTRFAASRDVVGSKITIDDVPFEVIGVLPSLPVDALAPASKADVWVPLVATAAEQNRGMQAFRVTARIRHGVSRAVAGSEINAANKRVESAYPTFHHDWTIRLTPAREAAVGNVRASIFVLAGAVGCVLLMACINIASLCLGRTVTRGKEFALRTALGASASRIGWQLTTENLLLSIAGGVLGLALAYSTQRAIVGAVSSFVPRAADIRIGNSALFFTLAITVLSGLLVGLAPVLYVRRNSLASNLNQQQASGSRPARFMLRGLVVCQTAFALVLLVSAGFMIRSLRRLTTSSPGFVADHVVGVQVDLAQSRYRKPEDHAEFYRRLLPKVREIAGIESAAAISRMPMVGATQSTSYQTEAHPLPPGDRPSADTRIASPGYFATLQIPLLFGRDFNEDDRANTPLVIVVNREAASALWPGEIAVGKRMQIYPEKEWRTVIGVVGGVKLQKLDSESVPTLYVPYAQNPFPNAARSSFVVVRTQMNPETAYAVLKRALSTVDDGQAIGPLQRLTDAVEKTISLRRFSTMATSLFALLAAALSMIGTYGVMSFAVNARRREIGVKAALGATPDILLWSVLREGLSLASIGVIAGLALTTASMTVVNRVIYGVRVANPDLYIAVAAALVIACLAACYVPARLAANVDPLAAMRNE